MVVGVHELRVPPEEGPDAKQIVRLGLAARTNPEGGLLQEAVAQMAADFLRGLQADVRGQLSDVLRARLEDLARGTVPVVKASVPLRTRPQRPVPDSVAAQNMGPEIYEERLPRGFRIPGGPRPACNPLWDRSAEPVNRQAAHGARSHSRR